MIASRTHWTSLVVAAGLSVPACSSTEQEAAVDVGTTQQASSLASLDHPGRHVWFENAYGGEKFFTFLANHRDPAKRIKIGFEAVLTTPRAVRFASGA